MKNYQNELNFSGRGAVEFALACKRVDEREKTFKQELKKRGLKGWAQKCHIMYCEFKKAYYIHKYYLDWCDYGGLKVGDLIAIGDCNKYDIVELISELDWWGDTNKNEKFSFKKVSCYPKYTFKQKLFKFLTGEY